MIERLSFHRFKQFRDNSFELQPVGVTLLAGGNNSGKTTILHGLAVWQFCRTAIEMERGAESFLQGASKQGLGLGDDEFSPINVPTLKHLWTNLRTGREDEVDGYTLKIRCAWAAEGGGRYLEFGLSLVNDRLFIKTTESNLLGSDEIPQVAYLPPFAGITDREMRMSEAIRRRRIGEGLAGSVLRNVLLDLLTVNTEKRAELRGDRTKIRDQDLEQLRRTDPWERIQATLRTTFGAELDIAPFRDEYHSYIRVLVAKGTSEGRRFRRYPKFNKRDLMVEGSGFLQWLSVLALALSPEVDVLLLDEPDSHLHYSLQEQLIDTLRELATDKKKQIMVATHATDLLRAAEPGSIFEIRAAGSRARYLRSESQKVGLLAGLGTDYAPRVDQLKRTKRLFLVEGRSDLPILRALAAKLHLSIPESWVEWRSVGGHKDRKQLYIALKEEIPELVALSLRDRDEEPIGTVGADLHDRSVPSSATFNTRKWRRRHIESYLIWPPAIGAALGVDTAEIERELQERFAIAVPESKFVESDAPEALMELSGKRVLKEGQHAILGQLNVTALDVARRLPPDKICQDVRTLVQDLVNLG